MIPYDWMGLFALGILWLNTLLVVGAAFGPLRLLLERRSSAARSLVAACVERGEPLAYHEVEQVGRRAADDGDRRAILFHDRRFHAEAPGGAVRTSDGESLELPPLSPAEVEVWVSAREQARAAGAPSAEGFAAAYRDASKARGFERTVRAEIGAGAAVWIAGAHIEHARLRARGGGPVIVASFDPRPWIARRIGLVAAFVLGAVVLAAGCTWLALTPPAFGTVSIVGAALGLAFFLLIQPAGVAVRDAVRLPSVRFVRGRWAEPRAAAAEKNAARAAHGRSPQQRTPVE
jgi:hypothetical protein